MIILESIRLRNFRAVREAFFKPKVKGITGLHGPNGAGKSTFLTATLFALFGVKPNGATVASLRRTNSGTEECSVSVVFKHLGQTVEVIREIKGSNNRVVVNIYVDGVPQTVTSVGAADTWISQRIGVDANGFLTAFIVRQKELDALVTARPAERKMVIEKLAGIETINEALKKARKDEAAAKLVLESIPGSANKVEEAEALMHLLSDKVNEMSGVKEEKQAELNKLQSTHTSLTKKLEILRETQTSILENESHLRTLQAGLESDERTIKKLSSLVGSFEEAEKDVVRLRGQHKTISSQITVLTQELNTTTFYAAQLVARKNEIISRIEQLQNVISQAGDGTDDLNEITTNITEVENKIKNIDAEAAVLKHKIGDYQEKIVSLQGAHHNCPTCNQPLDDVEALTNSFELLISEYTDKAVTLGETKGAAQSMLRELQRKQNKVEELISLGNQLQSLETELHEVETKILELPDPGKLNVEIENLNSQLEKVTEAGFKARQFVDAKQEYEEASNNIGVKKQQIHDLTQILVDLKKHFSPDAYEQAKINLNRNQNQINHVSGELNEIFAEYSGYQTRLNAANTAFKSAMEQWERKKELFKAQERKALTTEVIDKFRQESVASLTPELSERATELISEITSGAYTEIRLDETFNVSVVNSVGEVRDVSWLSGGEESAVAFALRLAIAFLITGDNPSLLWLDEVLTAQDAERRSSMLSTIRHLPIEQIILINHTEEAADIVDLSVIVVPDLENGSTLVT